MLKNKKGFTLMESIVTIAMFAILGTMLLTGFSTVIRHMGEAEQIKNSTNKVFSELENADTTQGGESVAITIEVEGQENINGSINTLVKQEKIDDSFSVTLSKFFKGKVVTNTTLTFYEELLKFLDVFKKTGDKEKTKLFDDEKAKLIKDGIEITYSLTPGLSNDNFRRYYYVVESKGKGCPELDKDIIEEAKRIYDSNPNAFDKNAQLEDVTLYMKPYYIPSLDKIILTAEKGSTASTWDGWNCKLFFNSEDRTWYYRVGPTYNISGLYKITQHEWDLLQLDLNNSTLWRKIEMK